MTKKKQEDPGAVCDAFNAAPIGTPVDVAIDGRSWRTRTQSRAWVVGGHTAVVMLEGVGWPTPVDRVTVRSAAAAKLPLILACLLLPLSGAACGGAEFTAGFSLDYDAGAAADVAPALPDAAPSSEAAAGDELRSHIVGLDAGPDADEHDAGSPPADALPSPPDAPGEAAPVEAGPALCCQLKSDCHGAVSHCNPVNGDMCTCGPVYGGPLCTAADLGGSCWILGCVAGVLEVCP